MLVEPRKLNLSFTPAVIIDARDATKKAVERTVISLAKQTQVPPSVKILVDLQSDELVQAKSNSRSTNVVDISRLNDLMNSHDGMKVDVKTIIDPYAQLNSVVSQNADVSLLAAIKAVQPVVIPLPQFDPIRYKKFLVTHVVVLMAGDTLPKRLMESIRESWKSGIVYDIMRFKRQDETAKRDVGLALVDGSLKTSFVCEVSHIKAACKRELWRPLIEKQRVFRASKDHRDINFVPIRTWAL